MQLTATALARTLLGPAARPVRATFFDKNPRRNWALGWHQDRTVAVRARAEVPGFTSWTVKSGIAHAVPPLALLERMLTLRLHLDDTPAANAPLLISPGTHRLGRIAEADIARPGRKPRRLPPAWRPPATSGLIRPSSSTPPTAPKRPPADGSCSSSTAPTISRRRSNGSASDNL